MSGLRGPPLQGGANPQIIQIPQVGQHFQPFSATVNKNSFSFCLYHLMGGWLNTETLRSPATEEKSQGFEESGLRSPRVWHVL